MKHECVEQQVCNERKKRVDEKLANHEERIETLEKTYQSLEKMNYQIKEMNENFHTLDKKIEDLKEKPNKRYDAIIMQIISFIIEAILVIVAVKIGLK